MISGMWRSSWVLEDFSPFSAGVFRITMEIVRRTKRKLVRSMLREIRLESYHVVINTEHWLGDQ